MNFDKFRMKKCSIIVLNILILFGLLLNIIVSLNYTYANHDGHEHHVSDNNDTSSLKKFKRQHYYHHGLYYYGDQLYYQPSTTTAITDSTDFGQILTKIYTNIIEILIDLIGLFAMIKENYFICLIYIVLGLINVIVTIIFYISSKTTDTLIQMILTLFIYVIIVIYVNDVIRKRFRRQSKIINENEEI